MRSDQFLNCIFEPTATPRLYWCSVCGTTAEASPFAGTELIYRQCLGHRGAWQPKPGGIGLGDILAWLLRKAGIRKPAGCGCNQRQAALNRWWNSETFLRRLRNPRQALREWARAIRR